jgi:hypothetical protein
MSTVDHEQIKELVRQLDALVPKEGAAVRIESYDRFCEGQIVANSLGFLRLGIGLLKAAYAPIVPGDVKASVVDVDFDDVLLRGSTIEIECLVRREDLKAAESEMADRWSTWVPIGCIGAICVTVFLAVVGAVAVLRFFQIM